MGQLENGNAMPDERSDEQKILLKHLELVIQKNESVNLTRISTESEGRLLHIEDSLAGLPEFNAAPEGNAADLGTGGGYPGIPLSVMSGRSIDLVESVGKKARAIQEIVQELGIGGQVTVRNERAEQLAVELPGHYHVVVARALASLPSLIELASPLLAIGGQLISYKSQKYEEELEQSLSIQDKLGMRYKGKRDFLLSDQTTPRSIIVFEKVCEPRVKLPRRPGMAQKNPYRK